MNLIKKQLGKRDDVKKKMLDLIESEHYKIGDKIPPEVELVKLLGCCRCTVREAIGLLINEGYLTHVRGGGTFVASNKQKRYTVAALFPDLYKKDVAKYTVNIMLPMVSGIIEEARLHNIDVIVSGCGCDSVDLERKNIINAMERQVDAVIICYMGEHHNLDVIRDLLDLGIPTVFVDRYIDQLKADYVVTDNFAGTYDAVYAMADLGVDNIYFAANIDQVTSVKDRILGYTAAANSLGLLCNVVYTRIELILDIKDRSINRESSEYRCLLKSLAGIKLPCAIFSVNPIINSVVQTAIEDLNIPKDQTILGHFDSDSQQTSTDRCYFEVDQPFAEMGAKAVQIVNDKINGNTELQQISLKPTLTIHNMSTLAITNSQMITEKL